MRIERRDTINAAPSAFRVVSPFRRFARYLTDPQACRRLPVRFRILTAAGLTRVLSRKRYRCRARAAGRAHAPSIDRSIARTAQSIPEFLLLSANCFVKIHKNKNLFAGITETNVKLTIS